MPYPTVLDSFTNKSDGVDNVMAADVNSVYSAIVAIETALGLTPQGTASDLVSRLAISQDPAGRVQFKTATTLTIASGVITTTQNYHRVDTEAAASTDNLDTINGITNEAVMLVIRAYNGANNVVIKHGTGNINCCGGVDITLDNAFDFAILFYDATLVKWLAMGSATLTAAATLSGTNVWTAMNTWNAAVNNKYSTVAINTTLDTTYYMIDVNAVSGAITIMLPAAASIAGRTYIIRKADSSANAVTVDGNASETINGVLTYAIATQYETVSIMSDGSNWVVL